MGRVRTPRGSQGAVAMRFPQPCLFTQGPSRWGLGRLRLVCEAGWWGGKSRFYSSGLQALTSLRSGLGLLGSWAVEPGLLGSPGRPSPLNRASPSSPGTNPSVCTSRVPTPSTPAPRTLTWQGCGLGQKAACSDLQAGFSALGGRPPGLWVPAIPRPGDFPSTRGRSLALSQAAPWGRLAWSLPLRGQPWVGSRRRGQQTHPWRWSVL